MWKVVQVWQGASDVIVCGGENPAIRLVNAVVDSVISGLSTIEIVKIAKVHCTQVRLLQKLTHSQLRTITLNLFSRLSQRIFRQSHLHTPSVVLILWEQSTGKISYVSSSVCQISIIIPHLLTIVCGLARFFHSSPFTSIDATEIAKLDLSAPVGRRSLMLI